ncbi:MAG: VCBS repeat-containing protein, partial [Planctomycetota bacterium]
AADVDEDGRDDLLSVTVTGQLLYSRQSTGGFDAPITLGFAAQEEPRVTDVDRDGLLDVIAYRTGPPRLVAFLQTSAGFSAVPVPVMDISGTPRTYEFLDVDLDGFTDLVAYEISGTFGTNRMVAYYGLAAGGFGPAVDLPLPTFGGTPSGLQVFDDLDGDGLVDLIYTRGQNDGATAWWTQNLGGRQFAPAAILGVIGENIRRIDLGEPVPGGPKSLLATTRTLGSFERYRAFEVLPNNTLGGAVQVEPIGIGATEAFFVDLGTGAQDVVIIDGILSRIGVAYNLAQRDVGMSFCGPAVPNSTGLPGEMSAIGSRVASRNALDLVASQLPPGATAFFLGSLTPGFVANPGGSSGNLCLGGDVGRLSQPGLVGPAGPDGVFRRRVDLTLMPQPQGPVTVLAQSTWYFQAWHRDALPGLPPTSNFTDGVEIEFD